MSTIASNAEFQAKGIFSNIADGGGREDNLHDQISQALALQLNLKTNQQANEKGLTKLLKAQGSASDLKQALQARAAVYGNLLNPS